MKTPTRIYISNNRTNYVNGEWIQGWWSKKLSDEFTKEYIYKDTMVKIFEQFANHLGYLMTDQNVESFINQSINNIENEKS